MAKTSGTTGWSPEKTEIIICKGIDGKGTKTPENFVDDCEKIRFVDPGHVKQVKRCEKCQRAFQRIGRDDRLEERKAKKATVRTVEEGDRAKKALDMLTKSGLINKIKPEDKVRLDRLIADGGKAKKKLAAEKQVKKAS